MTGTPTVFDSGAPTDEALRLAGATPVRMPCHRHVEAVFVHPHPTDGKASPVAPPGDACGKVLRQGLRGSAVGSGAALTPRIVLTALHVLVDEKAARIDPHVAFLAGSRVYPIRKVCYYPEYLETRDAAWDFALCITDESMTGIGRLEVNLQYDFPADDPITMLGYPGGGDLYRDNGYANTEDGTTLNAWSGLATRLKGGLHGVSGGPWLDTDHRVVGINATSDFDGTINSPNFADGRFAALLTFAQSQVDVAFPDRTLAMSREPCLR